VKYLQLINTVLIIPVGEISIVDIIPIDATIGLNTTLVFSYTVDITVEVTVLSGNEVTITKDETLKLITAFIVGEVVCINIYFGDKDNWSNINNKPYSSGSTYYHHIYYLYILSFIVIYNHIKVIY